MCSADTGEGALDSQVFQGPVKHSEINGTVITAVRRSELENYKTRQERERERDEISENRQADWQQE